MRTLVDRRTVAILTRSRGSVAYIQRLNFSAGRGRGQGDIESTQVSEAANGGGAVLGQGLGFGDFGLGRGRGRGSTLPSPSHVASQPLPFKPFTLTPGVTAGKTGSSQQNGTSEAESKNSADNRFDDAVTEKDVHAARGKFAAPAVSSEVFPASGRDQRSGFSRARQGAGRSSPLSQSPPSLLPFRNARQSNPNSDKVRASAWESLSQLLAAPKQVVQPTSSTVPAGEQLQQSAIGTDFRETSTVEIPVGLKAPNVAEVDSQISQDGSELSSKAHPSQTAGERVADPVLELSDASYVAMIKYHQAAGRFDEVGQIYEEMQADSIPISISTYSLLIQIFSQAGQYDRMDKVYKQMRQALTQVKEPNAHLKADEENAVVYPLSDKQTPAADVPVTLEEVAVVKSSSDQGDEIASVTPSDELSARLGEWDSPAVDSSGAAMQGDGKSIQMPTFKLPTPESPPSSGIGPGEGFAQQIEESKRLLSFRELLNLAPPGGSSESTPRKGTFNPFNLPTTPSPSIFGGVAGRGRGMPLTQHGEQAGRAQGGSRSSRVAQQPQIGADGAKGGETSVHAQLSREQARERALALLAKTEDQRLQAKGPSTPAPARPQLSREDAVQRAVAVMNEGVERNLSREEEKRRRRGAVDTFSDATTLVADRFRRRTPESAAQQAKSPQAVKDRLRRQPRFFQRREEEEEPQVPLTLREMTQEDEKRLRMLEEEEQFKSSLHSKFLLDFEPEYAMEYFGINPDIDDLPQKSLEEILADAKPYLMIDGMTEEQWQGEVQDVMAKAPHLENLVNLYAGPDRLTAKEQNFKLQAVAETMPAHVGPEIQDFMSQALLTLQSNPGIRMHEKQRLMKKFVSGLSSF